MEANAETTEMLDLSLQSDFCLERKKSPCSVLEKGLTVKKKKKQHLDAFVFKAMHMFWHCGITHNLVPRLVISFATTCKIFTHTSAFETC